MTDRGVRTWFVGLVIFFILGLLPWTWQDRSLVAGWLPTFVVWGLIIQALMVAFVAVMAKRAWPEPDETSVAERGSGQ